MYAYDDVTFKERVDYIIYMFIITFVEIERVLVFLSFVNCSHENPLTHPPFHQRCFFL